jgi:3-dehydroquinate synthase
MPPARAKTSSLPVVVITGFMGTGKTEVGQALAVRLGLEFVDTDELIEHKSGLSVAEVFAKHGEAEFREMEDELCETLAHRHGVVIATGGGTLMRQRNFDRLSEAGDLVLLVTEPDTLVERLQTDASRPLLRGGAQDGDNLAIRERIVTLLEQRAPTYDKIATRIDTTHATAEESAERIAAALDLPCRSTSVSFLPRTQDEVATLGRFGTSRIHMGRGILSNIGKHLQSLGIGRRVFFLMPPNLQDLYRRQLTLSMDMVGAACDFIAVRDGDAEKTFAQVASIIDALAERGATRDSTIVPVGGGVTGDIGGFVASVYMRGVPLVHVPTTLLAQVDSSIGGKVGVNHSLAKNLIGSFYQPHAIIDDPCTLRSLPIAEISNGMAEVVKSALIGSAEFFEYLENQMQQDASKRLRDIDFLERCVVESVRIKADVVTSDPFERDRRRLLNLGHTVGHAIEASMRYGDIQHGLAVSMGRVAALRVGGTRGTTKEDLLQRTTDVLSWCGLPVSLDGIDSDRLLRSMALDKKIRDGKLHFVLVDRVGHARVADDISTDDILSAIREG